MWNISKMNLCATLTTLLQVLKYMHQQKQRTVKLPTICIWNGSFEMYMLTDWWLVVLFLYLAYIQ